MADVVVPFVDVVSIWGLFHLIGGLVVLILDMVFFLFGMDARLGLAFEFGILKEYTWLLGGAA